MSHDSARTIRPRSLTPVSLAEVIAHVGLTTAGEIGDESITGITIDSRDVRPGDIYVGMPGARVHGATFAEQAVSSGAVAVLTDAVGAELIRTTLGSAIESVPVVISERPREILGVLSAFIYGTAAFAARYFGVTGTNGKTSVVYMLAALLNMMGEKVGISTTAERRIGEEVITSSLTSPESSELHALLARMREESVTNVALEVSAQAVVRHRIDGVLFDVVAFNNFSQDHLDEFGSMESYFEAKAGLFSPEHAQCGVVVVDTEWGGKMAAQSRIPVTTLATEYGSSADWHMAVTRETLEETAFVLSGPNSVNIRASIDLIGTFMAENAALAMVMLIEAGYSPQRIIEALGAQAKIDVYIPGRLERVSGEGSPTFLVDYGHTPGSFRAMLDALQRVADGKIIMLFGADGDRDATKREEMGAIAARGADELIICDYHPRTEDPAVIRAALLQGAKRGGGRAHVQEIPDPSQAIRVAIDLAAPNDVILYAGPGHEEFREVAGTLIPFSARDEVRGALREAGYNA